MRIILGVLQEGYDEKTFHNKKDCQQQKINKTLKFISEKLSIQSI
jgi:hypothetical protein